LVATILILGCESQLCNQVSTGRLAQEESRVNKPLPRFRRMGKTFDKTPISCGSPRLLPLTYMAADARIRWNSPDISKQFRKAAPQIGGDGALAPAFWRMGPRS
jgi:hypothetical protein